MGVLRHDHRRALAVAAIGPGEWSLDNALGIEFLGVADGGYTDGGCRSCSQRSSDSVAPPHNWPSVTDRARIVMSTTTPTLPEDVKPGRTWVKVLLGLVCLGITGMWVYAFFFASKESVSRVDDLSWSQRAEQICAEANEARGELIDTRRIDEVARALSPSGPTSSTRPPRSWETMIDDVVAVQPRAWWRTRHSSRRGSASTAS